MKFGELISIFLFVWIIISYIVVAVMDAVKSLSFGFANPSFGVVGEYALYTVDNILYALGLLFLILVLSFLPGYKLKLGFLSFIIAAIAIYLIYRGVKG